MAESTVVGTGASPGENENSTRHAGKGGERWDVWRGCHPFSGVTCPDWPNLRRPKRTTHPFIHPHLARSPQHAHPTT